MTVTQIVSDYLKQNGFDGLHSHPEDNDYGRCGCGINELFKCGESCAEKEKYENI